MPDADGGRDEREVGLADVEQAKTWYARFAASGEQADLDHAVDCARRAAEAAPGDYRMLADLAALEEARFRAFRELGDLDHMVAHQRAALRAGLDAPGPDRYELQVRLAVRTTLQAGVLRQLGFLDEKTASGLMTEAVTAARAALALTEAGSRQRSDGLAALIDALRLRYQTFGSLGDLEMAVAACEELASGWAGTPRGQQAQRSLALTLAERGKRTGSPGDLRRAAAALREWLVATPPDAPGWAAAVADLESVLRQAIAAIPPGDHDRGDYLADLGTVLCDRFEQTGALGDLDAAVEAFRQAVQAGPADHPHHAGYWSKLSRAQQARYEQTGAQADLEAWVTAAGQAVSLTPAGDSFRGARLAGLGVARYTRYERTMALADLDAAIGVMEQAIAATDVGDPYRAARLSNLSAALQARFDRTGVLASLDTAIGSGRQAVAAATDPASLAMYLSNLGAALHARFERAGSPADLDEAIAAHRRSVAAAPGGEPNRPGYLSNLGLSLRTRFERLGRRADLDEAIELLTEAVAATPSGDPHRGAHLLNLGLALGSRFERTGDLATLNANVDALEQAVTVTPAGDPERTRMLSAFGAALSSRYGRTGALADLDAAVDVIGQAVSTAPPGYPDRALYLSTLGDALATRYQRAGALADLDAAIDCGRQAAAGAPADHPDRAEYLAKLGDAYGMRYAATGMPADLDTSIDCGRQAVDATPADHPRRATRLSNLAIQLRHRAERTGAVTDMDAAIDAVRQAVAAVPADHPHRPLFLSNLGNALATRFDKLGALADLDEAVEAGRQSVAAVTDPPNQAMLLVNLGNSLRTRYERAGDPADLAAAVEAFRDAVAVESASPRLRATAAHGWGRAAAAGQRWSAAVAGYEAAIELAGRVVPRGLTRADQERLLAELGTLGPDAAACCLHADRLDRAVELFEYGRGILLGQALDSRADLTELARCHPGLAGRFTALAAELDRADATIRSPDAGRGTVGADVLPDAPRMVQRRRETADAFDRVLAEIRAQPGFDGFLRPVPLAALATAAHGTLVLVNVSRFGSHALLLSSDAARPLPVAVPLPGLSPDAVRGKVVGLLDALEEVSSGGRSAAEAALTDLLGWLWDEAAHPVLRRLGIHGPPAQDEPWPRLWWCPSGLLSFLPLHAAGYHDTRFESVPRTVIDRVVSSYIPTIRTLMHASRPGGGLDRHSGEGGGRPPAAGPMLAVAMPHTPGQRDLPGAQHEATSLRRKYPDLVTILSGPEATHDEVVGRLPAARLAHFACHGRNDLTNPSASHLLLHDYQTRPLTVTDVARLNLEDTDLAFLSACATAQPGTRLTDEAIQLAAAFALAGYRHVIGTLWPIADQLAADLADAVYAAIAATGQPAHAVHAATRQMRNRWARQPSAWASHIHVGA